MVFGGYLTLVVCTRGVRRRASCCARRSTGEADRVNADAFVNRELSWLEFNRRVLEEAQDPSVPLLERVKFLAIFSSNLDEFFMVRVARAEAAHPGRASRPPAPDGLTPLETHGARCRRASTSWWTRSTAASSRRSSRCSPAKGIVLLRPKEISEEQQRFLEDYFRRTLLPVLTPLAVDPGHPFPYLGNRSLCLVVSIAPVGAFGAARQRALRDPHPEPGAAALRRRCPTAPGGTPSCCSRT